MADPTISPPRSIRRETCCSAHEADPSWHLTDIGCQQKLIVFGPRTELAPRRCGGLDHRTDALSGCSGGDGRCRGREFAGTQLDEVLHLSSRPARQAREV